MIVKESTLSPENKFMVSKIYHSFLSVRIHSTLSNKMVGIILFSFSPTMFFTKLCSLILRIENLKARIRLLKLETRHYTQVKCILLQFKNHGTLCTIVTYYMGL
jgi:hypothetical protein